MDESILKSNFVGRDGFRWWIGQIPPNTVMDKQINGGGWGVRYKVRIMGYHPANEQELSNEDLPWSQVLIPPTAGTGGGNRHSSVLLTPGDIVFGFFMDGDNAQIPVIMGAFARTAEVSSKEYSQPFVPFTGYTNRVKKPPKTVLPQGESGDQNANSQTPPTHIDQKKAPKLGKNVVSYSSVIGDSVRFGNGSRGSTISKINTEINNVLSFVQNASAIISDGGAYLDGIISFEIQRVTKKIQDIVSGLVNGMINQLYKELAPVINQGLKMLYQLVYNLVLAATQNPGLAHQAGVAAQQAMVNPVLSLQQAIPSLANTIIGGLGGLINSILTSVVKNATTFSTCAANQFTGVLTNSIIGQVSNGLSSQIGAIGPITQFFGGFSVANKMRSNPEILGGLGQLVNIGQTATNFESSVNEWIIGRGPKSARVPNFSDILKTANDAFALANSIQTATTTATETTTNPPSERKGAVKSVGILSEGTRFSLSNDVQTYSIAGSGTGLTLNILETSGISASISRVEISNPGSGYQGGDVVQILSSASDGKNALFTISSVNQSSITSNFTDTQNSLTNNFNNFVTSSVKPGGVDGCYSGPPVACKAPVINIFGSNGSGATAIPILGNIVGQGRTRTGGVIAVKVTNPGSGYDFPPFVEVVDDCDQGYGAVARAVLNNQGQIDYIYIVSEGENYPVGDLPDYVISDVNIIDPGLGYSNEDKIIDNLGNRYSAQVEKGAILKVTPDQIVSVTDLPSLTILSDEGSGAILRPVIESRDDYETRIYGGRVSIGTTGTTVTIPRQQIVQSIDCITK